MKISTYTLALLAGATLAAAGCDGATTAPQTDTAAVMRHALLEESGSSATVPSSTICRNNLKQLTLSPVSGATLGLFVHDSPVEVDRGDDGGAAGSVYGHLLAQQDADGCGEVHVQMGDGSVRFISESVSPIWEREPLVLELAGQAEFCPARGGPCELAGFTGVVHVEPGFQGQAIFQLSRDGGTLDGPSEYRFAARTFVWSKDRAGGGNDVLSGQNGDDILTVTDPRAALWMDGEKVGWAGIQLAGIVGTLAVEGSIQVMLGDGGVKIFSVLLGLLVREADGGYSWVVHILPYMDQSADGHGQRLATHIVGSELRLRSGAALQDDDTWILGGVVYQRVGGDWICL
jgi:hypothetical protein